MLMRVIEPSTMVSDYLLGAVAVFLAFLLAIRRTPSQRMTTRYWSGALLLAGVAAFAGGTFHGLLEGRSGGLPAVLWTTTMVAIGLSAFCFVAGAAFGTTRGNTRRIILAAAGGELIVYLVWIVGHSDFLYAMIFYLPCMVAVLVMVVHARIARRDAAAPWVIAGIAVSFAGAVVQASGWDLRTYLSHNDVYHLLQAVGFYGFFRGGRLLQDRPS